MKNIPRNINYPVKLLFKLIISMSDTFSHTVNVKRAQQPAVLSTPYIKSGLSYLLILMNNSSPRVRTRDHGKPMCLFRSCFPADQRAPFYLASGAKSTGTPVL